MCNVLKSIELEDGRVLRYMEGMPDIDTIISGLEYDINRFTKEVESPNCSFDRKAMLNEEIRDFKMAVDGWNKLKEEM